MRLQLTGRVPASLAAAAVALMHAGVARAQRPELQSPSSSPAEAPAEPGPPEPEAPPPRSERSLDVTAGTQVGSYADTDHVFVQTPSISGSVADPTKGWRIDGQYLVDIVSAASVDIVSTASRRWEEVRQAGSLSGEYKPGTLGASVNGQVSSEPDYLSWSAGGALTKDLFAKNLTLRLGYEHGHDVAGRTGTPFTVFSHPLDRESFKGAATLLLDRATVGSLIADVVLENGDPSKPYRYIPLFAPGTSVPLGASIDWVMAARTNARPLEQLPLSRQRFALSGQLAHRFHLATLRLDERLYVDSWGLKATTTDVEHLLDTSARVETGPHVRLHAQTSVVFWQRGYVLEPGFDYPALRTGDRELGPLLNATGGWTLKLGLGPPADPTSWTLGFDLDATWTQYLDDLYVTHRLSAVGGVSLEANL